MDRKTECYQIFRIYDVTAAYDASANCEGIKEFSNLSLLFDENVMHDQYGTLEDNLFILDGNRNLIPDEITKGNFGLWSLEMSNENRTFTDYPFLEISFTQKHSSVGITLYFDTLNGDLCNGINVKWYGIDGLISDKNFMPDKAMYFCDNRIENYTKITITFKTTLKPYRWLKLERIDFGLNLPLDGSNINNAELLEEVDPISAEIRINTLNFELFDEQARFSLVNPQGYYDFLQRKQRVDVHERINENDIYMGSFYLNQPSAETEHVTNISCIDMIGVIDQTEFYGGIYKNKLVPELINEIAASAGAGVVFSLDVSFATITVSGHIPICTHRQALQQVAFAIGAVVDCSRSLAVKIKPAELTPAKTIGTNQNVDDHKATQTELVTSVAVTAHEFVANDDATELLKSRLETGDHEIKFSAPAHSLSVTGATIKEHGANYAILNVLNSSDVILSGKGYNDNLMVFKSALADIPANERANELQIEDITMIDSAKAQAIADRVLRYHQNRLEENGSMILSEKEKAGMMVDVSTMGNQTIQGTIESLHIDLVNGFMGVAKVRGVIKR